MDSPMENTFHTTYVQPQKMANEEHYRQQAACYRDSAEYNKMKVLYPVLKNSIENCRNEKLIDQLAKVICIVIKSKRRKIQAANSSEKI